MVSLQEADHRVIAELMANNSNYSKLGQLKGMLEDVYRIQSYLIGLVIEEADKKKA